MQEKKSPSSFSVHPEPGSFRDPDNQVYRIGQDIYRALSPKGLTHWDQLRSTRFAETAINAHLLISAEKVDVPMPSARFSAAPWAGALRHPRIPFISYPYEWPFGMLRQAAWLTLTLLENALEEHWILKDSSPYNIQWRGLHPVFIDIASFVPWAENKPWRGYEQFCELFLYPLMIYAYRGIPYHAWLRSSLEGLSAQECWALLGPLSWLRSGVLKHVGLHVLMQRNKAIHQVSSDDMQKGGFNKKILMANIQGLQHLVTSLKPRPLHSTWTSYDEKRNYDSRDYQSKRNAVDQWLSRKERRIIWDLGCNAGDFSRIAAKHAQTVIAMDGDAQVIDQLYDSLKKEGPENILPLVMNLANPSPDQGWDGRERAGLTHRGQPDVILALALVHHWSISANIPLQAVVQWLAGFETELLIEFIDRDDERVIALLDGKDIPHEDYRRDNFERLLNHHFTVQTIGSFRAGRRTLYACEPKKVDLAGSPAKLSP